MSQISPHGNQSQLQSTKYQRLEILHQYYSLPTGKAPDTSVAELVPAELSAVTSNKREWQRLGVSTMVRDSLPSVGSTSVRVLSSVELLVVKTMYLSMGNPSAVKGAFHDSLMVFQLLSSTVTLGGSGGP